MDHTPEHPIPKQAAISAIAVFNDRFTQFTRLTDPLLALVEAAQLKGRVVVFLQLGLLEPAEAAEINALLDMVLGVLLDEHLTERYDTAPVRGLMASVRDHIRGL